MLAGEGRGGSILCLGSRKNLPMKYREVIHLFYYEGYSTAQVADILKKNEATVRSHLHRGRAKLKKILEEAYDFRRNGMMRLWIKSK